MNRLDALMSTSVLSGDETHAMIPEKALTELFETARRYEAALKEIAEYDARNEKEFESFYHFAYQSAEKVLKE